MQTEVDVSAEQLHMSLSAPGQAALAGLAQLVRELEPTIGIDAAERVRMEAERSLKAVNLPEPVERALLHRVRS